MAFKNRNPLARLPPRNCIGTSTRIWRKLNQISRIEFDIGGENLVFKTFSEAQSLIKSNCQSVNSQQNQTDDEALRVE